MPPLPAGLGVAPSGLAVRHSAARVMDTSRRPLTKLDGAPELVAPIQVQAGRLVVRALIEPRAAYAAARAVVERREELPEWVRG